MYDLDEILDTVQSKYYRSKTIQRPTICWSSEFWTSIFGRYDFYNNCIQVSRVLDDADVTYDMIASVVYHESLHQDFPDHDKAFTKNAMLMPGYNALRKQLNSYAAKYFDEFTPADFLRDCAAGKERVIFIVLPYGENYANAFYGYDGSVLIDFNVRCLQSLCDKNSLFVFLVRTNDVYNIVAWCEDGKLYPKAQKIANKKFGYYDNCFQLKSNFDSIHVIPNTNCIFGYSVNEMPDALAETGIYSFDVSDELIAPDINYLDSYSDFSIQTGFDIKVIDCIPQYADTVDVSSLSTDGAGCYHNIWVCNAICKQYPSAANYAERARIKADCELMSSAFEDIKKAYILDKTDAGIAALYIKLAAITGNIAQGYLVYKENQSKMDGCNDKYLQNSISCVCVAHR